MANGSKRPPLTVENTPFEEIEIGASATLTRALDRNDIEVWAVLSGDINLVDLDPGIGDSSMFEHGGGQAAWASVLFTTLAGTALPGIGSVVKRIDVDFARPAAIGMPVTATITVTAKDAADHTVTLACEARNPAGEIIASGSLEIIAPQAKLKHPLRELPKLQLRRDDRYLQLMEACKGLEPIPCAVMHPCSPEALEGAIDAAQQGLIEPILVGPEARIRALAQEMAIDISPYPLEATAHSHESAARAVALVREGRARMLMKGSLHSDELLAAVLQRDAGLATERRLSHCFLLAVPAYPRVVIITDAAINIAPTLEQKRDIIQNAIELARSIGVEVPKVAILSAVETVTTKIPSTIEAAALCKMAERGQISGGVLDGPLAFDNAIDVQAAATKGIDSPVAGRADILIVPDMEAGNMLAKQFIFMANAEAAGIVLGARVPIVLTSRADSARTRLTSCAVAVLYAQAKQRGFGWGAKH